MSTSSTARSTLRLLRVVVVLGMVLGLFSPLAPTAPASAANNGPNPTALTVTPATGIYGATTTLQATLRGTNNGGNTVVISGVQIVFTLNGVNAGSATTNSNGVASLSRSLAGINAGTYNNGVSVSFAGTGTCNGCWQASSESASLTVSKASATITLGQLSQNYDGTPKAATATTDPAGLTGVSITYGGSATAPTDAGSYNVTASLNNANYTATDATGTLVIAKANATVTLSNLSQTYNGSPKTVGVTTTPAGLDVNVAYKQNGQAVTNPTDTGNYDVKATVNNSNYQGSATGTLVIGKADQQITFGALANKTYGDAPFTVSATGGASGNPVTFALTAGTCSVSGNTVTITGAGSCTVTASQAGNANYNAAESVSQSFDISKADAIVTLSNLDQTYDGSPKTVSWTTDPTGLNLSVAYSQNDEPVSSPTNAGNYAVTATVNDPNFQGTATGTLVIDKADQQITFGPLATKTYGDAPFTVSARADSDLAVTFAVTAGTCSVSGDTVTITGAGSCTITASQAGNANYNAAESVSQSFDIAKATATVTLAGLQYTYDGNPHEATASTDPTGLNVSILYNGSAQAPTNAGSYPVIATVNDDNYVGSETGTLIIDKASQTISFAALENKTYGDPDFPVSASATSGLPVNFTANGDCTVSGTMVSITGAGGCVMTASQGGNDNYKAANAVQRSFSIAQAPATIMLGTLIYTYDGTPKTTTATTDPANLTGVSIAYSQNNQPVTEPIEAGSYGVVATLSNRNYTAPPATGTLVINKADQTISFGYLEDKTYNDPDFSVNTDASSGLPVSLAAVGNCTVSDGTVHITGAGSCTITASQGGNNNFNAAPDVPQTFNIAKATADVGLSGLTNTYDGNPHTATASTTPTGLNVSIAYSQNGQPVSSPTNAGSYDVVATVNDANYQGSAQGTLVIAKGNATITLGNLSYTYDGTAHGTTASTNPAGLNVSITYNGSALAPTNAGNYPVVATVNDNNYQGTANGTLIINKASQTITFNALANKTYGDADFTVSATGGPSGNPVTFSAAGSCTVSGTTVHITGAGTCTITAAQAGNTNYLPASVSQSFNITGWTFVGFYQPVDMSPPGSIVYNSTRAGSTIPLKFNLNAGNTKINDPAKINSLAAAKLSTCEAGATEDPIEVLASGATSLRWDATAQQFIYNWKTPTTLGCYKVTITSSDAGAQAGSLVAYFRLR